MKPDSEFPRKGISEPPGWGYPDRRKAEEGIRLNDIRRMRLRRSHNRPADAGVWWAACESGHEIWDGPDRDSYDRAKDDAKQHDNDVHSGVETPVVLNTDLARPASIMTSITITPAIYVPTPADLAAVKSLYDKTFMATFSNYFFVDVKDLVVQWGQASIVDDSITTLPSKLERHEITFTNCQDREDKFVRTIKDTTKKSISYSVENSITSSNEYKLGVAISAGSYAKFDTDMITKNSITTSQKETQTYSEDIEITYDEQLAVPPRSIFVYEYTAIKGLIRAEIRGQVIIDARFEYRERLGSGRDVYLDPT
jgi:hypothetical protein